MDELSEIGRKLIDVAMEKDDPPPADESWGTLVSRLTGEAPREVAPPDPEPAARSRPRWIAPAAIVAVGACALAWWWLRDPASVVPPPPAESPPSDRSTRVVAKPEATRPEAGTQQAPSVEHLIADAESALAAGDPHRAMALLQRHAELAAIHPQAERRMALRILVLCAQGEHDAARDEAQAFLTGHPDSQWAGEVRRSCAAP